MSLFLMDLVESDVNFSHVLVTYFVVVVLFVKNDRSASFVS